VRQCRVLLLDQPVRTPRLVLRAFTADDLDAVVALHADPQVRRYIPWPARDREQCAAWLAERVAGDRLAAEGDSVAWAVERSSDARVVGAVNAWWRSVANATAEIGFVFARDVHGQGLASEAVVALVGHLFEGLPLRRVTGRAAARNEASARLMARIGMRHEAHFVQDELFKGEWTDTVVFAVLRDEWTVRAS
jgi:RimJ/RimL family protein N-acetyltransferase